MKRLYAALGFFLILLLLAVLGYFFGPQFLDSFRQDPVQQNITPSVEIPVDRPLTKEEQKDLLDELAPENPIDTPEEFEEQINLLEQLQNEQETSSDLEQLEALQVETSADAQLELLEQLQSQ